MPSSNSFQHSLKIVSLFEKKKIKGKLNILYLYNDDKYAKWKANQDITTPPIASGALPGPMELARLKGTPAVSQHSTTYV